MTERIAKRIARAGICSRRDAERIITEGKVKVNGEKINSPALNVSEDDVIHVNGKLLPDAEKTRLWLYNKPRGLVTTHKDTDGRPTVFDNLPAGLPRVISVGRLDMDSEGLLLLTNDGALARNLELPARGWVRRYRVRVHGKPENLDRLKRGITIDGVNYGRIDAEIESIKGERENKSARNIWLSVAITEGKNREVRRIFEHLGHPVSRLIRIAYGPFQLGKLERGAAREVSARVIKEQLQ